MTAVPGQPGAPTDPVVSNWSINEKAEFLEVKLTERLAGNTNYTLTVSFSGLMLFFEEGLYWDVYQDSADKRIE